MIEIPPFVLPSNPSVEIKFTSPEVAHCMKLSDLDADRDEAATTLFLNMLQGNNDSATYVNSQEWTGQDRRTALWWIYIATHEEKKLPYEFDIEGESIIHDIDLLELGEHTSVLSINPNIPILFNSNGTEYSGTVSSLNGHHLEQIELLRISRQQYKPGTASYNRISSQIAIREIVYAVCIEGEPENRDEAHKYRFEIISKMDIETEFKPLIIRIDDAKRQLIHGLPTVYEDGRYYLVANIELKEGEGVKPSLFPFIYSSFFPTFRIVRMG